MTRIGQLNGQRDVAKHPEYRVPSYEETWLGEVLVLTICKSFRFVIACLHSSLTLRAAETVHLFPVVYGHECSPQTSVVFIRSNGAYAEWKMPCRSGTVG